MHRQSMKWMVPALAMIVCLTAPASANVVNTSADPGYWLPEDVSTAGHYVDAAFNLILYLTSIVGIAVFAVLLVFVFKYRYQEARQARFIHGNTRLEAVWTLIPTMILAMIAAYSQTTWSAMKFGDQLPSGDDVVRVNVYGRQFQWYFHYPGADGKFGAVHPLWAKNTGQPEREIGLRRGDILDILDPDRIEAIRKDPNLAPLLEPDPNAKDDLVVGQMVVPVGRPVVTNLFSIDVIHSFFLPNFRVKQDLVPGLRTTAWFESTRTSAQFMGTGPDGNPDFGFAKPFDIVCAELCGQGHFIMRGQLFVVTEQDYDAFLKREAEFQILDDDGY